ncbi:HAD family hydrolase [Paenibacillus sp. N4]|uniref:HAD hydrolase family protein n=1 Tax=Paenibacillus vietnamensis TaxID=2590547 RepID=UPI001CD17D88|nr:HAD hydrolase family protein [Paenibacillus vietnamensis]MCA0754722.1 HAD family hydrolase [Paenibacillus vietnamensis]
MKADVCFAHLPGYAASFVCYNGAVVTDEAAGIGEHVPIPRDSAAELLEYCKLRMPECTISVEVNDVWYAAREIDDFEFFNPKFRPVVRPVVLPIDELKRHDATKILLSSFSDLETLTQLFGNLMNIIVTDQGTVLFGTSISVCCGP